MAVSLRQKTYILLGPLQLSKKRKKERRKAIASWFSFSAEEKRKKKGLPPTIFSPGRERRGQRGGLEG